MGDILPQRRQTVVDRLRRRIEHYRRHQSSCLPRYDNNLNGLLDQHHQETLNLRDRYLAAKAKKANKKGDHKNKDTSLQNNGGLTKPKRTGDSTPSPLGILNRNAEECDRHNKLGCSTATNNQGLDQGLTQFSVEIVQQFTGPGSNQGQQIQTNVTVTAVAGNIKTSDSPVPNNSSNATSVHTTSTSLSNLKPATNDKLSEESNANSDKTINSNLLSNNIECKQEPELDLEQCSAGLDNSNHGVHNFPDSLQFGLMDDSMGIDPESIKDLIDGLSSDDINDFNDFEKFYANEEDFKSQDDLDKGGNLNDVSKSDGDLHPNQQMSSQNLGGQPLSFSTAISQSGSLLFTSGGGNVTNASDAATMNALSNMNSMNPTRVPSYSSTLGLDFPKESSPAAQTLKQMAEQHQSMQQQHQQLGIGLNSSSPFGSDYGLGAGSQFTGGPIDFLNSAGNGNFMNKSSPNSMFPFGTTSLSSINNSMLKPDAMFRPTQRLGLNHLSNHLEVHKPQIPQPMQRLGSLEQKSTLGHSPGQSPGSGQASSITGTGHSPNPGSGPSQTSNSASTGMTNNSSLNFGATKPLSHFSADQQPPVNTPSPSSGMQQIPSVGQYLRNSGPPPSQQPPPPQQQQSAQPPPPQRQQYMNMAPTARLQASQNQQMHVSQNGQQLQVSQGQHIQLGDIKGQQPVMYSFSQQQQASASSDQYQLSASQSQTVTFGSQMSNRIGGMNPSAGASVNNMHSVPQPANQQIIPQMSVTRPNLMQQQMLHQQMMDKRKMAHIQQQQQQQQQQSQSRQIPPSLSQFVPRPPPPDYASQVGQLNQMVSGIGPQQQGMMSMVSQNQMFSMNGPMRGGMSQQQMASLGAGLSTAPNGQMLVAGGPRGMMGRPIAGSDTSGQSAVAGSMLNAGSSHLNLNGSSSMALSGARMNSMTVAPVRLAYSSSMLSEQRPPNVNIGPEGLNIGMRGMNGQDWRQRFLQNQPKFPQPGPTTGAVQVPPSLGQMPVPPRTSMSNMGSQRGFSQAQNMADGLQMMALQQARINMARGANAGALPSGTVQNSAGSPHQMGMLHQQAPSVISIPSSQSGQMMSAQMSSSVSIGSGASHLSNHNSFLPNSDSAAGDFNEFFENGGFNANDLLNSLDLDMQNGNSGVNLM